MWAYYLPGCWSQKVVPRCLHLYTLQYESQTARLGDQRFLQVDLPARPVIPAGAGRASATPRRTS